MGQLSVDDMVKELDVSKSYLYKVVKEKKVDVKKSETGRYQWNSRVLNELKFILDISNNNKKEEDLNAMLESKSLKRSYINNRRYLGNKYSLSDFIRNTVNDNCKDVNIVADVFSGTGSVANVFKDKMLITNDLLYSNYLSNFCWFYPMDYSEKKLISYIEYYNSIKTSEDNYMRKNFSDTFFSANDCSKIGFIRENIEKEYKSKKINQKEYAVLITSLLYAMDRIANTVGHYDAYRKNVSFDKELVLNVLLPDKDLNNNNKCYNLDANELIKDIKCDLLYLDPPYNSRQYCDAYHLLENVARWEKPKVYGVARKMDRTDVKSDYCLSNATEAFEDLIDNSNSRYILLSYNNMSNKGNDRSNAKILDEDILKILSKKGKVTVFEEDYKSFTTGKSNIKDNKERLFLCETYAGIKKKHNISCPFNYTGGKYRLLDQMQQFFPCSNTFIDVFAGGGNVGINSKATKVIFNDKNTKLINLLQFIKYNDTDYLLNKIDKIINDYELSNTRLYGYKYYDCDSSKGLSSYNKEKFMKLRIDYNNLLEEGIDDYAMLYVLIVFSFNNQIRFNKKGQFNLPVGKRDFNSSMRSKLLLFSEELKRKDISFHSKDFREFGKFIINNLTNEAFVYCDPPYLITKASYNENGGWTENDEMDLLLFLDELHNDGFKFSLSNVLNSKNSENIILKNWIKERNYKCHYLNMNYSNSNYQRKQKNSRSQEVLITNY